MAIVEHFKSVFVFCRPLNADNRLSGGPTGGPPGMDSRFPPTQGTTNTGPQSGTSFPIPSSPQTPTMVGTPNNSSIFGDDFLMKVP